MIKVSEFVKRVPQGARPLLPASLRDFRVLLMPWLSQVYYHDKALHYEVVKLPQRYGDNRLELGLHFESRDQALNTRLLKGFEQHLFEIRDALDDDWWAEPWDRGWAKIYTTLQYQVMDEEMLEQSARQLAQAIIVMQPIYTMLAAS